MLCSLFTISLTSKIPQNNLYIEQINLIINLKPIIFIQNCFFSHKLDNKKIKNEQGKYLWSCIIVSQKFIYLRIQNTFIFYT